MLRKRTFPAIDLIALEREACRRSLATFAKRAWHILEPATPLKWGWALDAICAHLEAVTRGEITRLLMNVPPGTMKSLLTGVIWPAWEWGPSGLPHKRFLATSHKQTLANGTTIRASDRREMMAAEGATPTPADRLRIGATSYAIVRCEPFAPGGVALFYDLILRA